MQYDILCFSIPTYSNGLVGRKYKNLHDAICDGTYCPWNEKRVQRAFAFGNGTMSDLKRFCKSNKERIISPEKFFQILETIPEKEIHLDFITRSLHYYL